jgi:predicted SAM-dependent methyltransferase
MSVVCFCDSIPIDKFNSFNNRDNAQCPKCNSLERHRMIIYFFNRYKIQFNTFLHFAPEKCLINIFKSLTNTYICGDIDPKRYNFPGVNIQKMDMINIPSINNLDGVFASHVLEHIIEDQLAINSIYASLITGGRFITMVPQRFSLKNTYEDKTIISEDERKKHFGQKDHVRWYGSDFSTRLKKAGFFIKVYYVKSKENDINKMYYDEKIPLVNDEEAKIFGFNAADIIYECIKK